MKKLDLLRKIIFQQLPLLAIIAVIPSCGQKDIAGEAFINLKSGESLKLGDMQVWYFGEDFLKFQNSFSQRNSKNYLAAFEKLYESTSQAILEKNRSEALNLITVCSIGETRTSSNGQFTIPSNARYILAFYERESPYEDYVWMLPIKKDQVELNLTGANMTYNRSLSRGISYPSIFQDALNIFKVKSVDK